MAPSKNIVFDVVGTLVGYEALYAAIEERLGEKLRQHNVKSDMFGYMWIEVAEREYTYNTMSGNYVGFERTFRALFWRMLWKAGVAEPRKFASEEDLEAINKGYNGMTMRLGAKECIQKLRDAGFTVWCFTMGGLDRVGNYFKQAGIELPAENLLSCDSSGIGKPDPEAYRPLLKQLSADGSKPWFAAAHMWDVGAARRTGFRGAYCTVWEGEPLTELFGEMDVIAETLPNMAQKVIESRS